MDRKGSDLTMFCVKCGKEFSGAKNARYCEECREKRRIENNDKMRTYVKERNKRLGLVNITIYKEDRDFLKKLGGEKRISIADVLKEVISKYN